MDAEYIVLCDLTRHVELIRTDRNHKQFRQSDWFKCLVRVTNYLRSAIEAGVYHNAILFYDLEDVLDLGPPKWLRGSLIYDQLSIKG